MGQLFLKDGGPSLHLSSFILVHIFFSLRFAAHLCGRLFICSICALFLAFSALAHLKSNLL